MVGGSGAVLPRGGFIEGVFLVRASFGMLARKPHNPSAVSSLAQDQLQWQGAPVHFSQQAYCCSLVSRLRDYNYNHCLTRQPPDTVRPTRIYKINRDTLRVAEREYL